MEVCSQESNKKERSSGAFQVTRFFQQANSLSPHDNLPFTDEEMGSWR